MALAADVEIVLSEGQGEGQQDSDGSHNWFPTEEVQLNQSMGTWWYF